MQMYRIRRILIQLVPQEPLETVSDNHFKKYSVISIRLHYIDHIVSKDNVFFLWIELRQPDVGPKIPNCKFVFTPEIFYL